MANKKKRAAAKKKCKNGGPSSHSNPALQRPQQELQSKDPLSDAIGDFANVPVFRAKTKSFNNAGTPSRSGMYLQYKNANERIRDWFRSVVPDWFPLDAVNDLNRAADHVFQVCLKASSGIENNKENGLFTIPLQVLADLKLSIFCRLKVGRTYGSVDEGHAHIIETLKYCRKMLQISRALLLYSKKKYSNAEEIDTRSNEQSGRYNVLADEDEMEDETEEEEEDDEEKYDIEDIRSQKAAPPVAPPVPETKYSIEEELIRGTDRFRAMLFLSAMDDQMGVVDGHYSFLKQSLRRSSSHDDEESTVKQIMECALVFNFATESVRVMELELSAEFPHLDNFYKVITLVFFYNLVLEIQYGLNQKVIQDDPHLVLHFVGELVEFVFHNKNWGITREGIARKFARKAKIATSKANDYARVVEMSVFFESALEVEAQAQFNSPAFLTLLATGQERRSIFKHSYFLGGDRYFLNTQMLLQKVLDVVTPDKKLLSARRNFFGLSWEGDVSPATTICGGMDQLFAEDILPELIETCRSQPISCLPDSLELVPLLNAFSQHLRQKPNAPVPAYLTFGFHAILTSMFLLQRDGDIARIAKVAKLSYQKLFKQLEEQFHSTLPNHSTFKKNVGTFKAMVNLPKIIGPVTTETAEDRAMWNPVVGGQFLLFATFVCSMSLGSVTVDSLGQLRLSLQLYNAFLKTNLIEEQPGFLKHIDKVFDKTKAVWVSGRPGKGGLAKQSLMAWGFSPEEASRYINSFTLSSDVMSRNDPRNTTRKLDEILPEQYSESYRRIVQRDFSNDARDYTIRHADEATDESKVRFKELNELLVRVNTARDSLDEDDDNHVLSMNLTQVGGILNQFLCELSDHMGWSAKISYSITSFANSGRQNSSSFENSSDNLHRQAIAQFIWRLLMVLDLGQLNGECEKAAKFMSDFLGKISTDRYTFFVEEDFVVEDLTRRLSKSVTLNPLQGYFPPGRTGATTRDPLRAFMHYKYTKSMRPKVRVVIPGKLTPLELEGEETVTPYKEEGSKLVPQTNGKYRHIASYSLEELVSLGWDGAKYHSSTLTDWVPFVCGYDSDPEDRYERVDVAAGKRAGTIGIGSLKGLYADIPSQGVVQLKK